MNGLLNVPTKHHAVAIALIATCLGGCEPRPDRLSTDSSEIDPSGPTSCYIFVQGDCHGWVPALTWFHDDYQGSSTIDGVCLHRAREYAIWCGLINPDDEVKAAFNVGSVTVNAQIFKPGFDFGAVDPRVVNFGMNWTPLVTSPTEAVVIGPSDPATSSSPDLWTMMPR